MIKCDKCSKQLKLSSTEWEGAFLCKECIIDKELKKESERRQEIIKSGYSN